MSQHLQICNRQLSTFVQQWTCANGESLIEERPEGTCGQRAKDKLHVASMAGVTVTQVGGIACGGLAATTA